MRTEILEGSRSSEGQSILGTSNTLVLKAAQVFLHPVARGSGVAAQLTESLRTAPFYGTYRE